MFLSSIYCMFLSIYFVKIIIYNNSKLTYIDKKNLVLGNTKNPIP